MMKQVFLNTICRPKQWKTISATQLLDEGYPVYGANGKIGYYSQYTHEKETVLITCRGATCGTINVCEPFSYVNGNAMALDNLSKDVDIKFLKYYLEKRGLNDTITGSAQPQITGESLKKIKIPLPPLPEQQRIAKILDAADSLRKKTQQIIDSYDELAQSIFLDMFGDPVSNSRNWKIVSINDIATKDKNSIVDGPFGSSIKPADYVENGVPIIRIDNIRYDGFYNDNFKFIKEEKYIELIRSKVQFGDILMARVGSSIGKTCIFNQRFKALLSTTGVAKITIDETRFNRTFIQYMFWLPSYRQFIASSVQGAGQPYLNLTKIKSLSVINVPFQLQNQFADKIELIEKQKELAKQSLKESEDLFNSLLQKAFKGELSN